jgi:hypothetical protein
MQLIACPGCGAARSGAPLIRDRHGLERSTQVGFTRLAHIGRRSRVNPRSVSAEKQENTGIGPTSAALAAAGERCAFCQTNPTAILAKRTQGPSPRGAPRDARVAGTPLRGPHDHRPVFMGPGSRYARPGRHVDRSTYGCRKRRPAKVLCFAPVLYRNRATPTCRAATAAIFAKRAQPRFGRRKRNPVRSLTLQPPIHSFRALSPRAEMRPADRSRRPEATARQRDAPSGATGVW